MTQHTQSDASKHQKHIQKKPKIRQRTDWAWFSQLFMTSSQEMDRVYSFNLRAHTWQSNQPVQVTLTIRTFTN